jgi:hypothetical protein
LLLTISGETAKLENKNYTQVKRLAKDAINSAFFGRPHLLLNDRLVFLNQYDIFRILSEINCENAIPKDILLRNVYKAEQKCVGSSIVLLALLSDVTFTIEKIGKLNKSDVIELVDAVNIDVLKNDLIKTFENASLDTSVLVDEGRNETHIVYTNSLEFPITQIKEFGQCVMRNNFKLVSYDGVIESISQIDKILNYHLEDKTPIILLARGFNYDVISTLLYNFKNKKIDVIPVTCKTDLSSEFVIKDLAGCAELDYQKISLSENTFTGVKIENEKLFISDETLLHNSKKISKDIKSDSKTIQNIEIKNFIEKRLKFLSSNKLEIFVGNEFGEAKGLILDRLNFINRFLISSKRNQILKIKINNKTYFCDSHSINLAKDIKNSILKTFEHSRVIKNVD